MQIWRHNFEIIKDAAAFAENILHSSGNRII